MESQLKNLEQRLEEQNLRLQAQLALQSKRFEEQMTQLSLLFKEKANVEDNSNNNRFQQHNSFQKQLGYTPKLEFLVFSGDNARVWVQKCEKYFQLCKIPDDQKVDMAAIHMTGKAESWFHAYITARGTVSWSMFVIDLCGRFKDRMGDSVVEQFNKLTQTTSLEDYLDSFEYFKSLMVQRTPLLSDSFFLRSFIRGLKSAIKQIVEAFKPSTFYEARDYARLEEVSMEATKSYFRPNTGVVLKLGVGVPSIKPPQNEESDVLPVMYAITESNTCSVKRSSYVTLQIPNPMTDQIPPRETNIDESLEESVKQDGFQVNACQMFDKISSPI